MRLEGSDLDAKLRDEPTTEATPCILPGECTETRLSESGDSRQAGPESREEDSLTSAVLGHALCVFQLSGPVLRAICKTISAIPPFFLGVPPWRTKENQINPCCTFFVACPPRL